VSAPATTVAAVSPARAIDFLELTKPRITFLVLVTTAVGYLVGARGSFDAAVFIALLAGTAFVSGGASTLNQYWEREVDGQMRRTRTRPLPSGRVAPGDALAFGLFLSAAGLGLLATINGLTYFLGIAALASYVVVYTPLKRVTSLCTIVGAVPGALPPLMGWVAARNALEIGGWALFAVLFLWQLPHFLAIGWIYREDYARGGFPMLTVSDPDGRTTAGQMILYCAALVPVTLLAGSLAHTGMAYLWGATLLGLVFLAGSMRFARTKSISAARVLFAISVIYLPVLLALMVWDR
jgi:protoheme IX farnesyltransferase